MTIRLFPFSFILKPVKKPAFLIFLMAVVVACAARLGKLEPAAGAEWMPGVCLIAAVATTLGGLAGELPWQNVLAASVIIGAVGTGVESLVAFAAARWMAAPHPSELDPGLFLRAAWQRPLVWVAFLLNARGVARLALQPKRSNRFFGLRVIALASSLSAILDFAWHGAGTAFSPRQSGFPSNGAPHPWLWLAAVGAESVLGFGLLVAATPWLINKKPAPPPAEFWPLRNWGLLVALAWAFHPRGEDLAPVGGLLAAAALAFAMGARGWRWRRESAPPPGS